MTERWVSPKTKMLEDAGYYYDFEHELYVNQNDRKAFSVEFVEATSEESLKEKIMANKPWEFHFGGDLSPGV